MESGTEPYIEVVTAGAAKDAVVRMPHRPIDILCDSHNIRILLLLLENGVCMKTDIYRMVARSANMAGKIDRLRDAGFIKIETSPGMRCNFISLTDKGHEVAELLMNLEDAMCHLEVTRGI